MCYNCGCQMPNNDMGKPESITNRTFGLAAAAMGLSDEESKRNALELLQNVLASDTQSTQKDWKPQPEVKSRRMS